MIVTSGLDLKPQAEGTCSFEWRDFLKKYGEDLEVAARVKLN